MYHVAEYLLRAFRSCLYFRCDRRLSRVIVLFVLWSWIVDESSLHNVQEVRYFTGCQGGTKKKNLIWVLSFVRLLFFGARIRKTKFLALRGQLTFMHWRGWSIRGKIIIVPRCSYSLLNRAFYHPPERQPKTITRIYFTFYVKYT